MLIYFESLIASVTRFKFSISLSPKCTLFLIVLLVSFFVFFKFVGRFGERDDLITVIGEASSSSLLKFSSNFCFLTSGFLRLINLTVSFLVPLRDLFLGDLFRGDLTLEAFFE